MKQKVISFTALLLLITLTVGIISAAAKNGSGCPIAENLEISTYREVSVEGRLKAADPDGDALTYEITTHPIKGEIELSEDGRFVYTPNVGKRGKDYFGYKATDINGNMSSEATVIIKIEKQQTAVSYSDMSGNGAHCAAIALAEKGIFVGEQIGGQYVFCPSASVSRGEFLTMCMKLSETNVLSGVKTTGFADDNEIPDYMKPYVSTALLTGVISGYTDGMSTAVFNGNNSISYPEAAVILSKSLKLTDVTAKSYGDTAPVWAAQACANLSACRIADYEDEVQLNRADCAKLLLGAMRVLENR